ncbi:MAG: hypothetical protein ACYC1U_11415 [Candidatus Aquicultorales bacterium]
MSFNWRDWRSIDWDSIDWMYLFRGKRAYVTTAILAVFVTALTVYGVSRIVHNNRMENLYQQGQQALADKSFEEAIEDFSELYKKDPKYKDAGKKLAEAVNAAAAAKYTVKTNGTANNGGTGGGTGTDGGNGNPPGGNSDTSDGSTPPPSPEIKNLIDRLPKSLNGYETMGTQTNDKFGSVERGFDSKDKSKVTTLLVTVMDRATKEGATAFMDGTPKVTFPGDAKALTVKGKEAYFGTDSRKTNAILVWADGSIVYELIMQSANQQAAGLESLLVSVADQF